MTRSRTRLHVLVVGAGVGGLAAACGLVGRGHRVTVLERAPDLRRDGGHLGVQSNATLALRILGAAPPVETAGIDVERFEIVSWGGRRLAWWAPGAIAHGTSAPNLTVPRHLVLSALADVARADRARAELVFDAQVVDVVDDGRGVEVRTAGGGVFRADALIAADGVRSTVRRLVGLPGTPRPAGYLTHRGVAGTQARDVGPHTARQWLGRGRTFGHWPLPGGRTYWVATRAGTAADDAGTRPGGPSGPPGLPAGPARLVAASRDRPVLPTTVERLEGCDTWRSGRVALLGDAAHAMDPVTGQGAAQALLDAVALTTALERVRGPETVPAALQDYVEARRGPAQAVAAEAAGLAGLHHLDDPFRTRVRDLVLRCTPHSVWQRRAVLRLDEEQLFGSAVAAGLGGPVAAPDHEMDRR